MTLKMRTKLAYGLGDVASNIVYQGVSLFLLYFWTNHAMIPATIGGLILLISRLFDGVSDIYIGNKVDQTKSKYGKARPWLLYLAVPFGVMTLLCFWTPGINTFIDSIYAFISYNLTMFIYTAINVPYGVLSSKITDDQAERGQIGIIRSMASIAGIGLVLIGLYFFVKPLGITGTFGILGLLATILFLITFISTKEVVGNDETTASLTLRESYPHLKANTPWLLLVIGGIVFFAANTVRTSTTIYFAQYIIGDYSKLYPLILLMIPGVIFGAIGANICYKRFGKVKTCEYSCYLIGLISTFYYMIYDPNNMTLLYTYLVLNATLLGIGTSGFFAMILDSIEFGEWKTGVRIEGITYSAACVGTKFGCGLGAAIVGAGLSFFKFNPNLLTQTTDTNNGISFLFLWLPAIMYVIFGVILHFNQIDKLYPQISADLKARKKVTQA